MGSLFGKIDILENSLRKKGILLDILLLDRTTKKNILWATDSYEQYGKGFKAQKGIKPELVTGIYGKLIQPRASKSLTEQRRRTREKAEVFTPLNIVDLINKTVDESPNKKNWKEYVRELKLEITCGEAPFIVSRYDPVEGGLIPLRDRVGFLDKKLQALSKYCPQKKDWIFWAKEAFKASYGYEWQGDNILLARENLLYSFIDYYVTKFKKQPTLNLQQEIAEIVSWNIFQMDGLKAVIPMSCHNKKILARGKLTLFGITPDTLDKRQCEGCIAENPKKHNGLYVKIMDWSKNKAVRFIDLV